MSIPLLFGPYGAGALDNAEALKAHGANAVWFHGFDETAFEACARHEITPCVEFKTLRADFTSRPDLIPTGADGNPIRFGELVQGVCLSNREFLAETEDNLINGIKRYTPAGIWLDYLTYAGWFESPRPDLQESCFCPDCIADFADDTGIDVSSADEILTRYQSQWTVHKTVKIANYAAHYAGIIKSHLPDCIIGAYMCPWTPEEFDGALTRIFAQDYDLLAESIDVFTPLIYCHKSGRPASWGRQFLEASCSFVPDQSQAQLILDFLDFPDSLVQTAASSVPSWGIQVFAGAAIFQDLNKARIFATSVDRIQSALYD